MSLSLPPPGPFYPPLTTITYFQPADAVDRLNQILSDIAAASSKIRLAAYNLTDATIVDALIAQFNAGVLDIVIVIDWTQAHLVFEHFSITKLRAILTPARVIYTTSPTAHQQFENNILTIDDAVNWDGTAQWTTEAATRQSTATRTPDTTLATNNSALIDAAAAYGLAHLPQT